MKKFNFTKSYTPPLKKWLICRSFNGFTLAEVLITLGIIGIVASLTIPTLINNFKNEQYKSAYKKAYSVASQAWLNAYQHGNLTACPTWCDVNCNADNFEAFKSEMKVTKDCDGDSAGCWDLNAEQAWGSTPKSTALSFIDSSGVAWSKNGDRSSGCLAGELLVDSNGFKKPNQYGKDRFIFVTSYFSADMPDGGQTTFSSSFTANAPKVYLYRDYPNSTTTEAEQTYRCPSMATSPCYYTSWITGEK